MQWGCKTQSNKARICLQPTRLRSAEFTLVREEVNGVYEEAALEQKAAEESWQGFKPLQGQEWSIQADQQMYQESGMATQGTRDSAPM